MILARLESSPVSATYTMNICGRIEGIDGVDKLSGSVYLIETNDQPYQVISTKKEIQLSKVASC